MQTKSNFQGVFTIKALPSGTYNLKISSISYKRLSIEEIEISPSQTLFLGSLIMKRRSKILNKIVITSKYYARRRRHGGACVTTRDPKKDVNKIVDPFHAGRQAISPDEIRSLPGGYR